MATSVSPASTPILAAPGGSFLLEDRSPHEVFTPEDLTTEQRQTAETAARFAREQILPTVAQIEAKDPGVMRSLLVKAAELGFAAVDIPRNTTVSAPTKQPQPSSQITSPSVPASPPPSEPTSASELSLSSGMAPRRRNSATFPASRRPGSSPPTRFLNPLPAQTP